MTASTILAGSSSGNASAEIPDSYRDQIDGPYWAALTTVTPDGQPQTIPHVALLVYDPGNPPLRVSLDAIFR